MSRSLRSLLSESLDLDVHADWQLELHQSVHRLRGGLEDVQEPLVGPHLELLARLLVDVRRAVDRVARDRGGQGDRPGDLGPGSPDRVHDLGRGLVQDPVVVSLESDADFVVLHFWRPLDAAGREQAAALVQPMVSTQYIGYSRISVIVPAPTVRPPSLMANRSPFSIAIGVISWISSDTVSPGTTISTPCGNFAVPVTSVVRKKNCGRYPLKKGVCLPPSSFVRMYACAWNFMCGVIDPGFAHTCH